MPGDRWSLRHRSHVVAPAMGPIRHRSVMGSIYHSGPAPTKGQGPRVPGRRTAHSRYANRNNPSGSPSGRVSLCYAHNTGLHSSPRTKVLGCPTDLKVVAGGIKVALPGMSDHISRRCTCPNLAAPTGKARPVSPPGRASPINTRSSEMFHGAPVLTIEI